MPPRVWRERERAGKVFEKELSLLWSQPLFKGAFSLKKKKRKRNNNITEPHEHKSLNEHMNNKKNEFQTKQQKMNMPKKIAKTDTTNLQRTRLLIF